MINLYQFPAAFGVPNPSPFCIKAEVLLKMAGVDYQSVVTVDPRKGPKGKLPAIEDGGRVIGDSELIRQHLERRYGVDFDKGLDAPARAVAHAFARMLEERTYWVMVYNRWLEESQWPHLRAAFFDKVPLALRTIVPPMIRRKVRRDLHGQGIGRHARDEIYALGIADVRAVAAWLRDKRYFMGAECTGVDATVYGVVENIITPPFDSPVKTEALKHDNLVAYTKRMRGRFFG